MRSEFYDGGKHIIRAPAAFVGGGAAPRTCSQPGASADSEEDADDFQDYPFIWTCNYHAGTRLGTYVIPARRPHKNMGSYWYFPDGRPCNSAAAAVLALQKAGKAIVDSSLREMAETLSIKQLERMALVTVTLPCGCRRPAVAEGQEQRAAC